MKTYEARKEQWDSSYARFIVGEDGTARLADWLGHSSLSGKTIWTDWVEVGAVPGYRGLEAPARLLREPKIPERFVLFETHGRTPTDLKVCSGATLQEYLDLQWRNYRARGQGDSMMPMAWEGKVVEYVLARRMSRIERVIQKSSCWITWDEFFRGLPARYSRTGKLILTVDDSGEGTMWYTPTSSTEPIRLAYGNGKRGYQSEEYLLTLEGEGGGAQ
jgi:hypothetical protein